MFQNETLSEMTMRTRLLVLAGLLAAGFAAPVAAGDVRWIDPWAPHDIMPELAGGPSAEAHHAHDRRPHDHRGDGIVWIDPWTSEPCHCADESADITGSLGFAGFNGGVGNRQTIVVLSNGFFFNPSLPAGQAAMTGARAAPVHPLGRPRF